MSNRGLMFILMIVMLCMIIPFTAIHYGEPGLQEGGWLSERSHFTKNSFTYSILLPICIWYILLSIVMFSIGDEHEGDTKMKRGRVGETR